MLLCEVKQHCAMGLIAGVIPSVVVFYMLLCEVKQHCAMGLIAGVIPSVVI
jgi:hypothetical protein